MPARENASQINRSQLIDRITTKQKHLSPRDVDEAVKLVFDHIAEGLAQNDRVELRGFGSFSLRERQPRMACNPRTGDHVMLGTRPCLTSSPARACAKDCATFSSNSRTAFPAVLR